MNFLLITLLVRYNKLVYTTYSDINEEMPEATPEEMLQAIEKAGKEFPQIEVKAIAKAVIKEMPQTALKSILIAGESGQGISETFEQITKLKKIHKVLIQTILYAISNEALKELGKN